VANEILSDLTQVELGGRHMRGSVLFADMAGFTALSERMPPVEVGALLNAYFGLIARAAELYQGTVDKFIGDCAMLVFGVPEPDADHRFKAIACAVLIRRITERLNAQRERAGEPRVEFRIGISSGEMLAGNMGSTDRMQFTVVGDTVNLASRISSLAAPGEIVIREDHYLDPEVQRRILARKYRALRVRGRDEPITLYRVRDVATTYRERMDAELAQIFETVPG
jgi:adenylate cyclase